jgi:hypothetical protein
VFVSKRQQLHELHQARRNPFEAASRDQVFIGSMRIHPRNCQPCPRSTLSAIYPAVHVLLGFLFQSKETNGIVIENIPLLFLRQE